MPDETGAALDAARDGRPPRDDLVRALRSGGALRAVGDAAPDTGGDAAANANGMPTLYGYFTRFDEWTEIDSWYEGNFMERLTAGSFKKTFREQSPKVLFQHGMDGTCGDKPLGPPNVLREEVDGPYYEVPLLDTSYVRELIPGLEANLYGASFRFSVMREEWVDEPGVSDHNPKGLPERTIKEVRCSEFGPVTFPAYPGASAAVRSMTDEWLAARMTSQPEEKVRAVLAYLDARAKRPGAAAAPDTKPEDAAAPAGADEHSAAAPAEGDETARTEIVVSDETETGAPGAPTPLYFGKTNSSRKATPGPSSTSLYIPKKKRKGWSA